MSDGGKTKAPERPPLATTAGSPHPESAGNNFDALRLLFAACVVAYHLATLAQLQVPEALGDALAIGALLGVQGFFILSGYLVYGSLQRSPSVGVYADKRVRRLYPAYAVVILAGVAAALALSPEARGQPVAVLRYLAANLVFLNFLEHDLPGLFRDNPVTAVNGALWTLKIEVLFYITLPVIAFLLAGLGRLRWLLVILIYIAAEVWLHGLVHLGDARGEPLLVDLATFLPGQMSFFITGVALTWAPDRLVRNPALALAAGLVLAATIALPVLAPLRAASLGWFALWLAKGQPLRIDAARYGDFSYGLYITHFPIIQAFVAVGAFAAAPALGAAGAVGATLIASILLWRLVERPALRADSAYRKRSSVLPSGGTQRKAASGQSNQA